MATESNGVNGVKKPDFDTLVVGAGFGGLRMVPELRKLNHSFKVIEAGSGVGGTWYWNRYPGARTDSESWVYILNFSKELNADWAWKERFPRQPEVLEYLNYVTDRFDMRKDIQFNTRVTSAHWDESTSLWTIATDDESWTCKYFISASGVLSIGRQLPFQGVEKFKGEVYRTYAWPKHDVSFKGKRVGVVGTGATSVQIIPIIAHEAAHVTVFQRTPNWVLPARNHPLTEEQARDIKARYPEIWEGARKQMFGMDWKDSPAKLLEQPNDAQVKRVLEYGWEIGGFRFIFETFADLLTSNEANAVAQDFLRGKIRSIVQDGKTAELLCPDHALMAKRPPLGHHYFETYNKPNVQLVSIKDNPIKEVTETGITLESADEYELDTIIFAIGFDAGTGSLANIDLRGKDDHRLGADWNKTLQTYLGITVTNFPNLFMISGPQSPFANIPIVIDNTADWISHILAYVEKNGYKRVEAKQEAMDTFSKLVTDIYGMTVLPEAAKKAGSWYAGANIPGKPVTPLFWFGGVGPYFQVCDEEQNANYPSIAFA